MINNIGKLCVNDQNINIPGKSYEISVKKLLENQLILIKEKKKRKKREQYFSKKI